LTFKEPKFAMNAIGCCRIIQVEFIEAFLEADPARVQHGPHRAIGEESRGLE
jgi:hypothetical protein